MTIRYIEIHGLNVVLWLQLARQKQRKKRKLVSSNWLKLWYLVHDGKFDELLWEKLPDDEKDFLHYVYEWCAKDEGIPDNKELKIAIGEKFKDDQKRLRVLEGLLSAGNLNPEIIKEISDIMDRFVSSNQIDSKLAERLKTRMNNSYEYMKKIESIK